MKDRKLGPLACVCVPLHNDNTHICWQLSCRTGSIWPSPAALMEPTQVTGRKWLDQRECGSVCHTGTHRWDRYRSEVACGCWWVIRSWYVNGERRGWTVTGHARPFNAAGAWMSNCFAFLLFFFFVCVQGEIIVSVLVWSLRQLWMINAHSVNKVVSKTETSVLAELITATGLALSS